MKKTKIFGALAAAVVVLAAAQPVFAATGDNNGAMLGNPTQKEIAANGETTVGIMEAEIDPNNVSYEVPLYVTVAAVKGAADLKTPTNYGITNTTVEDAQTKKAYDIAVTAMTFQKVAGATWDTVGQGTNPQTDKEVSLKIGGVDMPATKGGQTPLFVDITKGASFYNTATSKFYKIPKGATLNLPIEGTIFVSNNRTDTAAAAQFKIKYTVSAVDANGNILGNVYAGDNSVAAGLGVWTDNNDPQQGGTFTPATTEALK